MFCILQNDLLGVLGLHEGPPLCQKATSPITAVPLPLHHSFHAGALDSNEEMELPDGLHEGKNKAY